MEKTETKPAENPPKGDERDGTTEASEVRTDGTKVQTEAQAKDVERERLTQLLRLAKGKLEKAIGHFRTARGRVAGLEEEIATLDGPDDDEILQVRAERVLTYPDNAFRGGPGYAVRRGDPYIAGREHVLEKSKKTKADPIDNPAWSRKLREDEQKKLKAEARDSKLAGEQPTDGDLPDLDE